MIVFMIAQHIDHMGKSLTASFKKADEGAELGSTLGLHDGDVDGDMLGYTL